MATNFKMATNLKGYRLRLFISIHYITANILDKSNRNLVAQASTIEHALKRALDVGHKTSPKSGSIVGEVLARRIKLESMDTHPGLARGITVDVNKEVEKRGVRDVNENCKIVWAIINGLTRNGANIIVDDGCIYDDNKL